MRTSSRRNPERILGELINSTNQSLSAPANVTPIAYLGRVVVDTDPENKNRIKVRIFGVDEQKTLDELPWCKAFIPSFLFSTPLLDELVYILVQNPWNLQTGRFYIGPVYANQLPQDYEAAIRAFQYNTGEDIGDPDTNQDFIPYGVNTKDVSLVNRQGSSVILSSEKNIHITSDILKFNSGEDVPTITLQDIEEKITLLSKDVLIQSFISKLNEGEDYSVVYGERLIEILRWMIEVLKTHTHGPNTTPVPTFYNKADEYIRTMKDYLLNENVRTR